jgi:hypothetical protein
MTRSALAYWRSFLCCLQERGCYVFAFAGPKEVEELELGTDMKSVDNLLSFLEKVGSFFVSDVLFICPVLRSCL